jgi:HlyD family secretion protein
VEPQAIVQSSVTMFPVLVSLNNSDGALKPGMNGQVVMDIMRKDNVLAVPSDAIRNARDAATVAPVLGVNPDSLRTLLAAGRRGRGGANGTASSTASSAASGAGVPDSAARARFRAGASSTRGSLGGDSTRRRRFAQGGAGGAAGAGGTGGASFGGQAAFGGGAGTGGGASGGGGGGFQIVFVKKDGKYTPRPVRVGISDFDYTEIVSGVNEGEQVALLGAALLQAQREQQQQRIRAGTGGGLQQQTTPAAGGGAGGAGGRTGGAGGRQGGN